jgi:MFS transporter, YNFM family, putative membrane transport protein
MANSSTAQEDLLAPEAPVLPSEMRSGLGPLSSVLAVCLCGVFAFIDLYATQPLLPLLTNLFHASKAAVGLTVSASTLGVALSAPVWGVFAERLSRRKVIVWSILALAVPTLLAGTSPSLHVLIFWRFVQGLIMPGIFAITIAYIGEEWPPQSVALVMSVYVSGTALGGFMGRIISGLAAERLSWHWGFVLLGLLTLAGSLVVARWLPHERHPRHIHAEAGLGAQILGMLRHLRNPRLIATFAVGFNVLFSLVGIFTYITFYLAAPPFRLSTEALSYLFVVYLIGLLVTPGAGYLISHVGLRIGIAGAILVSMLGVLLTLSHSLAWVICGLALLCTGVFISQASATSYLREAAPAGGRVSAAGLYISCYYIGGTVAGVVPSYLWAIGKWPACVAFIMTLQVTTMAIALIGWRERG